MQSTERTTSDFISETEFYDKYFGFIITKRQLEGKTANGNQKFLVSVGREGEVIAKHIAVRVYSHKTGKWYMSYAAKPTAKLERKPREDHNQPREEQYQPKRSAKDAKFEDELEARAVASMLDSSA
jgi:hypothetical protein